MITKNNPYVNKYWISIGISFIFFLTLVFKLNPETTGAIDGLVAGVLIINGLAWRDLAKKFK